MANVLHKEYGYNTRAVGLDSGHALIPVDDVLVEWADEIVCAEDWMADEIKIRTDQPVYSLELPDEFGFMEDALVEAIKSRYQSILNNK